MHFLSFDSVPDRMWGPRLSLYPNYFSSWVGSRFIVQTWPDLTKLIIDLARNSLDFRRDQRGGGKERWQRGEFRGPAVSRYPQPADCKSVRPSGYFHLFITLLQGVIIFVVLCCKKTILRKLEKKFNFKASRQDSMTSHLTQVISLCIHLRFSEGHLVWWYKATWLQWPQWMCFDSGIL